jgi:N4-gp56 family major capsid protein
MSTTTTGLAADLAPLWLRDELMQIAEKLTVFADLADDVAMPEGEGKTFSAQRYERLPLPNTPLTEGVTPDSTPLTVTAVSAMLEQWGMVVTLTDVGMMTTKHPALTAARDRLGNAGAELWDREIQRVVSGGGTVNFPGGKTSRSTLVQTDVVSTDLLSQTIAQLRQLGAPTFVNGYYAGVVDPFVEQDFIKDPTFIQAHSYAEVLPLMNAEIGRWRGVRWKRSNYIPIVAALAAANFTAAAADVNTPQTGETNFAAGSSVLVQVAQMNTAGQETGISAVSTVTNAQSFSAAVTITAAAATGPYRIYVSAAGGAVALSQVVVNHVSGTADVRTFIASGTPNGANRFVISTSGAPAQPPAPAAGVTVHRTYVFGKSAFATPHIGAKMTATITPPTASDSDPLQQRRRTGFKWYGKTVILNTDFYRVIESASAFG